MLKRLLSVPLSFCLLFLISSIQSSAQCTTAVVNWDNLDYLQTNTAGYSAYINTAAKYTRMVQTQAFALGRSRLTISHNYTAANNKGENTTNTAETGSRGTGADVQWTGNGTIVITFDTVVTAASFSVYDIDASQKVTVTATNGAVPVNVTMAKLSGTVLTILGSGTPTASATATATTVANNNTDGTINVDIAGPLTSITIGVTLSGTCASSCGTGGTEDGSFWLSDISACVVGSFPNNYYAISQPFTGQPAYVLAVHDLNTVYMVDPATGRAVALFQDNSPRVREINDVSYDPYKRIVYYSIDGLERNTPIGNPDSVRNIKKYDVNTETISQLIDSVDRAPFNIPVYWWGLQTGGAAFYNGSLYMAVDGTQMAGLSGAAYNTAVLAGREGTVWRIDFAADSITPVKACQVVAHPEDNGTTTLHDWGDITIKDGIMYDYNRNPFGSGGANYSQIALQTNTKTTYAQLPGSHNAARQACQQWNGQLIWAGDSITNYDGTNVLTYPKKKIVAAPRSATWVAGAGDGAEAFRPKADFGDAPATYDPIALSPALNERDTALRIGATFDWEWNKQTSALANGDGADEDGLAFVPVFDPGTQTYLVQVQVYNHTDSIAKLCAWFDYNGNGVFDASEGLTPISVPKSTAMQSYYLWWSGIVSPIPKGSYTFLRIRLATNANGMTTSKSTGYMFDGETEDYRVIVDNFPLSVNLLSFNAKAVNSTTARLNWSTTSEDNLAGFGIERSADGTSWTEIAYVSAKGNTIQDQNDYLYNDNRALKGKSFYRLRLMDKNNLFHYSEQRVVNIKDMADQVQLMPNPARTTATVYLTSDAAAEAMVSLFDLQGRKLRTEKFQLVAGGNSLTMKNLDQLPEGTYMVQIINGQQITTKKLLIGKIF